MEKKDNLYHKLNGKIANNLIIVDCSADIVDSAVQIASDCLPIDIQSIIGKIYHHFHVSDVPFEAL